MASEKLDNESICLQQIPEVEIKNVTDNQMNCEHYKESSPDVKVLPAESTIGATVDYEDRLSNEELQYKQSRKFQESPITSRAASSSSISSGSVWYNASNDDEMTASDVSLTDDEVVKRATFFVKTFVKECEEKLLQYSEEAKPGSKTRKSGKIVELSTSIVNNFIPPNPCRLGLSKLCEGMGSFFATEHRKGAKKVSATVIPLEKRKILVEGGLEIFQSLEGQFTKIVDTDRLSWERGIEKLAIDAVSRVINYILANRGGFFVDLITKGIVLGESKRGYKVLDKEFKKVLITSELYKNVGIKKAKGQTVNYYQYNSEECVCVEIYSYRLPFAWELEKWEEVEQKYVLSEIPKKEYVYILDEEKKKELANSILKEINGENLVQKKDMEDIEKHLRKQDENICQSSFNFGQLPEFFIERKKILKDLTIKLHNKGQELKMLRVVLISGEPGTGKSELARGYGFSERRKGTWAKIMWVGASSYTSLSNSFHELAERLGISTKGGQGRETLNLLSRIYIDIFKTQKVFLFLITPIIMRRLKNFYQPIFLRFLIEKGLSL